MNSRVVSRNVISSVPNGVTSCATSRASAALMRRAVLMHESMRPSSNRCATHLIALLNSQLTGGCTAYDRVMALVVCHQPRSAARACWRGAAQPTLPSALLMPKMPSKHAPRNQEESAACVVCEAQIPNYRYQVLHDRLCPHKPTAQVLSEHFELHKHIMPTHPAACAHAPQSA
jgi:hypothetical protein